MRDDLERQWIATVEDGAVVRWLRRFVASWRRPPLDVMLIIRTPYGDIVHAVFQIDVGEERVVPPLYLGDGALLISVQVRRAP